MNVRVCVREFTLVEGGTAYGYSGHIQCSNSEMFACIVWKID